MRGKGTATDPAREADAAAMRAWHDLPQETRARVVELAAAGDPHPDAEVRAVAENWARAVLRRRPWGLIPIAAGVVVSLVMFAGPGEEAPQDRNNIYWRRRARRVLEAGMAAPVDGD